MQTIGIDIGGTKISMACLEDKEITSEILSFSTPYSSQDLLETIFDGISQLLKKHTPTALGIATAGSVDLDNSKITGSTGNMPDGYSKIQLKKLIEEKFGLKTLIENDANAAAYAEFQAGAAIGHQNTIMVTLGTGIGGGIIICGRLLRGNTGAAAEIGHIPLTHEKRRKCTCGDWDCWEAYGSGTGYATNAREIISNNPGNDSELILKNKTIDEITSYDVIAAKKENNPIACQIHELWEDYVLQGMISLSNIFDPQSIVLSGGMAKFIDIKELEKELHKRTVISKPAILSAKAENYAGIIGAGILAAEKYSSC